MLEYIDGHGVEVMFAYIIFVSLVGSMPPLPKTAPYLIRWAFAAVHSLAGNLRNAAELVNVKLPRGDE